MTTRFIMVIILKCIQILNPYVVQHELTQCCRSIILQKQTKEKKVRFVVARGRRLLRSYEGCQKIQTPSYKINTRNIKYSMISIINIAVHYI